MIIKNHNIDLLGQRAKTQSHEISERLVQWRGESRSETSSESRSQALEISSDHNKSVLLDISQQGMKKISEASDPVKTFKSKENGKGLFNLPAQNKTSAIPSQLQMMKMLLEKIFGIKVETVEDIMEKDASAAPPDSVETSAPAPGADASSPPDPQQAQAQGQSLGWGIQYSYHEVKYEKETVSFTAAGTVTSEDGRKIQFDAQLEMSKETLEEYNLEIRMGDALKDPLAINLDGAGVALSTEKMAFDLDADGNKENISILQQGSGYLALDKNNNNTVDNGSELFGPASNNGFLELRAYDDDKNLWIDEKDAVYFQLRLWTRNNGEDQLQTMQAADIGAIYLGNADTKFSLGDNQGMLRESGIYLKESGGVGFVQEIDLAMEKISPEENENSDASVNTTA